MYRKARRRTGAALVLAMTVAALAAPSAQASSSRLGVYDCYSFDFNSGILQYVQALQLTSSSRYAVAPGHKGRHLSGGSAKGRYRVRRGRITWLSGPYAHHHPALYGIFHHAAPGYRGHRETQGDARIEMFRSGADFMSCYRY